jgi:hypothetical protein
MDSKRAVAAEEEDSMPGGCGNEKKVHRFSSS